ncbi:MAG: hypothetical protein GY856_03995 [bacterium]|nr:hypothetical protein [bacterium]
MAFDVEIYRCDDSVQLLETRPLEEILRRALEGYFRRDLAHAQFLLYLHAVPEYKRLPGRPAVENLMPEYGYASVYVVEDGFVTYRHPHAMRELVARPVQEQLRAGHVEGEQWGYRVVGPGFPRRGTSDGLPKTMARPRPEVEKAVAVEAYAEGETPSFKIRRVPDPDPPLARLADFEVTDDNGDFVKVLVHDEVARQLEDKLAFSDEVEEGGFLVGRVYRDEAHDGTFLVEVNDALGAQHTGASLLHFTFTGDSFQEVKRRLHGRRDDQLLGWYHTHLFPASEEMGLSTIDLELHFTTFKKPWQLAGLVNFERDGGRKLRFYVRRDDTMALCPQWTFRGRTEE